MLKFSFGLPKKLTRRFDSMPQVGDIQQLLTQAIEDSGKDVGIAWVHHDEQFRLFVRHDAGDVGWRLFHGTRLSAQHFWSSSETNLRSLYSNLLAQCNDLAHVPPQKTEAALDGSRGGFHADSIVARKRGQLEDGTLEQLMQSSIPIKRTYLATTDPMPVNRLIERVGLPVEAVVEALKELIAAGLLGVMDSTASETQQQLNATSEQIFSENVRARITDFEQRWAQDLATPPEILYTNTENPDNSTNIRMQRMTASLMRSLQELVKYYSEAFNRSAVDTELHVLVTDLGEVADRLPNPSGRGSFDTKLIRWRASTPLWSLSARARPGLIELFIVSAADAMSLGTAEHELQAVGKFHLGKSEREFVWLSDALPVNPEDVRGMIRTCMRELIRSTVNELLSDEQFNSATLPESVAQIHARQTALEKQNLAQKIVSQQEEIQRRIARDLHDAVIADVTLLKRSVSGETSISREEVVSALDQITARLREICYDLSPSDLKDWGLQTTIEAMLDQLSQRTRAECSLVCEIDIPSLDSSVELHIFRIIQEALNNCAKYSGASYITVSVKTNGGWLQFIVEDNGKGFESAESVGRHKDGGMGMSSMQERVDLIRTLYPTRLQVISEPGKGTITTLSIKIRR